VAHIPEYAGYSNNSKTLISNYADFYRLDNSKEKICYFGYGKDTLPQSVFYGKVSEKTTSTIEKTLNIRELEHKGNDWIIAPFIVGLFTLAIVIARYSKPFLQLTERVIYLFKTSRTHKDNSRSFQGLNFILDFLFILSFSIMVDLVVRRLGLYSPPSAFEYLIVAIVSVFLFSLRVFRWIVYRLAAIFSNQIEFFKDLYVNSALYTRLLGVLLLPNVFLIAYTTGFITTFFIYLSLAIALIVLIIRIIRLLNVFIVSGFSIFYFILYLCALEIAPLLIILKEAYSRYN